ncbi:Pnap_2097 family protein [Arboricoccus pini]|nr:Pnap_2097 family protein [Arboricoccus pini]
MSETAFPEMAFLEGQRHPLPARYAAPSVVVVGMPELAPAGLAETWLLKYCGHRHWLMLAAAFGQLEPAFQNSRGQRLYPSFVSLRLADLCLEAVREGARLIFEGELSRLSATRFASRQRVSCDGRVIASIEMISVFIHRHEEGCNERVARDLPAGCQCALAPLEALPDLARRHHTAREQAMSEVSQRFTIEPCPLTDFNGAGFLYFASFQAFLERADWHWWHELDQRLVMREIHYFGNVGPAVPLAIELLALEPTSAGRIATCAVRRLSDDAILAIARTEKRGEAS